MHRLWPYLLPQLAFSFALHYYLTHTPVPLVGGIIVLVLGILATHGLAMAAAVHPWYGSLRTLLRDFAMPSVLFIPIGFLLDVLASRFGTPGHTNLANEVKTLVKGLNVTNQWYVVALALSVTGTVNAFGAAASGRLAFRHATPALLARPYSFWVGLATGVVGCAVYLASVKLEGSLAAQPFSLVAAACLCAHPVWLRWRMHKIAHTNAVPML